MFAPACSGQPVKAGLAATAAAGSTAGGLVTTVSPATLVKSFLMPTATSWPASIVTPVVCASGGEYVTSVSGGTGLVSDTTQTSPSGRPVMVCGLPTATVT